MSWGKSSDSNFERIRKQYTGESDERKVSKKDRTTERATARKGKEWTRSTG